MSREELKAHNRSKFKEALLVGGCFALGALPASALSLWLVEVRYPLQWLILTSVLAAFITATMLWKILFGHAEGPPFGAALG